MKKVVTAQGKTVEEAVERALAELDATREEVDVEVLVNPSRRLLGFRKELAEVKVTCMKCPENVEKVVKAEASADFESLVDDVLEGVGQSEPPLNENSSMSGVRVRNSQLEWNIDGESNVVMLPHEHVTITVNGQLQKEAVMIQSNDDIAFVATDTVIPPQFTIQLIENNMIALLTFTPGKKITRTVLDTNYTSTLSFEVEEEMTYFNDLHPQQIVGELKAKGVKQGIIFPAIQKVLSAQKEYELIVARGESAEEGTDGNLEIHIEVETFDHESLDRVDFREMNSIQTVKEEDVIATHILPVPGKDGRNLFGQVIPAKQVKDVVLRLGKNVELRDEQIVSNIAGNPIVDARNQMIRIDVNPEFYHPGEVGLESGNIRSEGDVRIGGSVMPSMFVGTSGSVQIEGAVTQAEVEAMRAVIVRGNVLSSTITVGRRDLTVQNLMNQLKEIVGVLYQIERAIEQILEVRGGTVEELTPVALKQLVHLLLEKRHMNFKQLNLNFIEAVEENESSLEESWTIVANRLHAIFLTRLNEEVKEGTSLRTLIVQAESLIEAYELEATPKGQLLVPYATNSRLYSNGDIQVRGKGVLQSILIAKNDVTIQGVCRGGQVIAQNNIMLQETGSENPVTTIVKTSASGRIKIGKAYVGTEIQIGNRKYEFMRDDYKIHARLNEDGELILK